MDSNQNVDEKLFDLYQNVKEINKKLTNGISSQLQEYRQFCSNTRKIIGDLDAPNKIE